MRVSTQSFCTMLLTLAAIASILSDESSAQTILYSETFSGGSELLNGATSVTGAFQTGDVAWESNPIFQQDGLGIDNDGAAILPFTPEVDTVYRVSADFAPNNTNFWAGIGFLANPAGLGSPDANRPQDRFAQRGGISWMLGRENGNLVQDVEIFGGPNTMDPIPDTDLASSVFNLGTTEHTLMIEIDTTGDGSSFTADYFVNGTSVSFGPQIIPIAITDITHVGLTNDSATPLSTTSVNLNGRFVDNFLLEGDFDVLALSCDFDGDQDCDADDINALYANIPSMDAAFDVNGDNTVDAADIPAWLTAASTDANLANPGNLTYVSGDLDLNGTVDSTDLGNLLNNFGASGALTFGDGDLNADGTVNSTDLGEHLNNFGFNAASAAVAVPEPGAHPYLLVAFAFVALRIKRRRR